MDYSKLSAALATLDISSELTAMNRAKEIQSEMLAAMDRGRLQVSAIQAERRALRQRGLDGKAAAQALLDGDDVAVSARTDEVLVSEQSAIEAGLNELRQALDSTKARISDQQHAIVGKLSEAARPTVSDLRSRLLKIAGEFMELRADAAAIRAACPNSGAAKIELATEDAARALRLASIGIRDPIQVSSDLVDALRENAPKIAAAGLRIRTSVSVFPTGR